MLLRQPALRSESQRLAPVFRRRDSRPGCDIADGTFGDVVLIDVGARLLACALAPTFFSLDRKASGDRKGREGRSTNGNTKESIGHGRVPSQSLLNDGAEIRQLVARRAGDIRIVGKGRAHLILEAGERLRVAQKMVRDTYALISSTIPSKTPCFLPLHHHSPCKKVPVVSLPANKSALLVAEMNSGVISGPL